MKNKAIIIGIIAAVGVAAYLVYKQFTKFMEYSLSFRSIKVKNVSAKELKIDLGLNFENKSDLQVVLTKQVYDVFINNVFVSKIVSDKEVVIAPKSKTPMNFDVAVGSKGIADLLRSMSLADLLNIKKQSLKLNSTIDVRIGSNTKQFKTTSEDIIENWMKSE